MKTLQHPRGDTATNDAYTGPESQFTVDTERKEIRMHDGVTPGGKRFLNLEQLKTVFMLLSSEFGQVGFDPGEKGYLVRVGDKEYALREITGDNGIEVQDGLASSDNTRIILDQDWISRNLKVSNMMIEVTEGTRNAFTYTTDLGNMEPNRGFFAGIEFHVAPNDEATLSIDGTTPLPLVMADGTDTMNGRVKENTLYLFAKWRGKYYLLGVYGKGATPSGGDPGEQDPGDQANALDGWLNFGDAEADQIIRWPSIPYLPNQGSVTHRNVDIEDGEARGFIIYTTERGPLNQGGALIITVAEFLAVAKIGGVYYVSRHLGDSQSAEGSDGPIFGPAYEEGKPYKLDDLSKLGSTFAITCGGFIKTQKAESYYD